MIIKVPRVNLTTYESRFFYEAEVGERKNVRRITLSDSGSAAVNGTNKDATEVDTDDTNDTATAVETEPDDEFADDDLGEDSDDLGDAGDGDTTDDGGDGVVTEPDDDAVDTDGGNDGTDDSSDEGEQTDNGEGLRKRALFSRLRDLHDAVVKYIEKLNMMMAYSSDLVVGYRECCDAFDELQTYIYDYMLIRFADASYPESMLFYQRVLTAINLILDKLEDIDFAEGNSNSKEKQSTKQGKASKKN